MPRLSTQTQRLSQAQLDAELSRCRQCFGNKWIHVAYSLTEEGYAVYTFPCRCIMDQGLDLIDCLSNWRYDKPPDYTTSELAGTVFIHPRLNKMKSRTMKAHLALRKAELGLDVEVDDVLPF